MMSSQITFKIIHIPENSHQNARLFLASNLNGWKADDPNFEFKKNTEGFYTLVIPDQTQKIEYKITQGSWDFSEADKNGNPIQNRVLENVDKSNTVEIQIGGWSTPKEKSIR